jgi:ABC-2 type transport system permease protein
MSGAIFFETLRHNWKAILWWGGGLALLAMSQALILQDVDAIEQMGQLMETLPPVLLSMFGGADIEYISTPEGYLSFRLFSFLPLVLAIYAVSAGLNVTANDEEQGILDMVISLPLPRWRIIVEKFLAYSLLMIAILAVMFVGLWLAITTSPDLGIRMDRMVQGVLNILPTGLLMLAFTIVAGSVMRRRNQAATLATIFVVGSYIVDSFGSAAKGSVLDQLGVLSFYRYYNSTEVIRNGLVWGNIALLIAVTAILVATGVMAFQRRDVGV